MCILEIQSWAALEGLGRQFQPTGHQLIITTLEIGTCDLWGKSQCFQSDVFTIHVGKSWEIQHRARGPWMYKINKNEKTEFLQLWLITINSHLIQLTGHLIRQLKVKS